jgi:hypothetical protein
MWRTFSTKAQYEAQKLNLKTKQKKEKIISAKRIDIHWFDENGYSSQEEFTIITIDSCEYLLADYDRSRMITHKENCKFCAERSKK